jgi:rhodanese-related sulfurtransferase
MIGKCVGAATLIAAMVIGLPHAKAQTLGIHEATLAEPGQATQEVSTAQLRQILADGSAVVLDTRTRAEFDAGHIPGARNLDAAPAAAVAAVERLLEGDKTKAVILYCNGPYCQASRRMAEQLVAAGFSNVRRYQLGIPVWRALGGPTAVEAGGVARIVGADKSAVFLDARPAEQFAKGSLAGAHNVPLDDVVSGKLKKLPLPEDDFNRRVVLFGQNEAQARQFAELLSKRPWHNVSYFPGGFESLHAALSTR